MTFDFELDSLSAIFSGHTWPHRAAFETAGVGGDFTEGDDGAREYHRVIPAFSLYDDAACDRMKDILSTTLAQRLAWFHVRGEPITDKGRAFLQAIKAIPSLFWEDEA